MDMSKYAGSESKYLKAADIKGRKVRLVIREVSLVEFEDDGKKKSKPVIFFEGKEKGMVLNGTNVEKLGHELGYDSQDWIGKEVEVSTTYYPNLEKDGLVLEVFKEVDFDDDIPF
jgi:hypothetical protein